MNFNFIPPVDYQWTKRAASLGGKSLWVGLHLFLFHSAQKKSIFKVSQKSLSKMSGLSRSTVWRCINSLQSAHLIKICEPRKQGSVTRVKILRAAEQYSEVLTSSVTKGANPLFENFNVGTRKKDRIYRGEYPDADQVDVGVA